MSEKTQNNQPQPLDFFAELDESELVYTPEKRSPMVAENAREGTQPLLSTDDQLYDRESHFLNRIVGDFRGNTDNFNELLPKEIDDESTAEQLSEHMALAEGQITSEPLDISYTQSDGRGITERQGDPFEDPLAPPPGTNVEAAAPQTQTPDDMESVKGPESSIQKSQSGSIEAAPGIIVDPETGEVLERDIICEKMGWARLPALAENANSAQIEEYEEMLDQVIDRICSYRDKAERIQNQADWRIAQLEGAIGWWSSWLKPYAQKLAERKLKRVKKGEKAGEFREKTLHLASGNISFEVTGGWEVENFSAATKYIESKPELWTKFKATRKTGIEIHYQTFLSVINKENMKDIPGTKFSERKALGKMTVKSP